MPDWDRFETQKNNLSITVAGNDSPKMADSYYISYYIFQGFKTNSSTLFIILLEIEYPQGSAMIFLTNKRLSIYMSLTSYDCFSVCKRKKKQKHHWKYFILWMENNDKWQTNVNRPLTLSVTAAACAHLLPAPGLHANLLMIANTKRVSVPYGHTVWMYRKQHIYSVTHRI